MVQNVLSVCCKCLRLSFRALRGNEIMQLRKIHAFFLLSRHLMHGEAFSNYLTWSHRRFIVRVVWPPWLTHLMAIDKAKRPELFTKWVVNHTGPDRVMKIQQPCQ